MTLPADTILPALDRSYLRSDQWSVWDMRTSDQSNGVPMPPRQKPYLPGARLIDLMAPADLTVGRMPLCEVIERRRSRRRFTREPLTLEELSFLLWATQGVRSTAEKGVLFRTVPSAGARHPFETYLLVNRVTGVEPGLYRYLSLEHQLCLLSSDPRLVEQIDLASFEQYVKGAAVAFIWSVIPYRTEWRYGPLSYKAIAMDAGHMCQNLYLASEAIGGGTCAIAAYDQAMIDRILGLDGQDEFVIYMAPVGKVK